MRVSLDPDKKACVAFYQAMENLGEVSGVDDIDWDQYVVTDIYESALAEMREREPDEAVWQELSDYFAAHN